MEPKVKQEGNIEKIDKFTSYLLTNKFKIVGLVIFVFAFILNFIIALCLENDTYQDLFQHLARSIAILGLLMIAISKEKVEDELIAKIRMQSYHYAVIGTVMIHFFVYFFPHVITLLLSGTPTIEESKDVSVLVCLLVIKIITFRKLKKAYNEE